VIYISMDELGGKGMDDVQADNCGHIAIHTWPDGTQQCKDCLRTWKPDHGEKK
jgi:hypothetical protein